MINPFKRKKKSSMPSDILALLDQLESDPKPIIDNFSRELLFDARFEDPLKIADLLGLPPISTELASKEKEESDKRVNKISWLFPLFDSISHLVSCGVIVQAMGQQTDDLPDEFWDALQHRLESVCMAALTSTMATLVDVNLVTLGEIDG